LTISKEYEAQILRYHYVEKWPVGTIARQLGLHHGTVDRVLSQAGMPKVERAIRASLVDPFLPFIVTTLENYPTLTASRLYGMVRERGYTGGPDHFRHLIAHYRPRPQPEAYHRLRTLPGEQGQVDWGLCRARHNPHYADFRTMPSSFTLSRELPASPGIEARWTSTNSA
jgi:transposase